MSEFNTYIVGEVVLLSDVITNPTTGVVVTDGSAAVTVYQPDNTPVTPAPVVHPGQDDPDAYEAQFTPTMAGWHEYVFRATGVGAGASRKRFYVSPVP